MWGGSGWSVAGALGGAVSGALVCELRAALAAARRVGGKRRGGKGGGRGSGGGGAPRKRRAGERGVRRAGRAVMGNLLLCTGKWGCGREGHARRQCMLTM